MKKRLSIIFLLLLSLTLSSCLRDNFRALEERIDTLIEKQKHQQEQLDTFKALLEAEQAGISIVSFTQSSDGTGLVVAKLSDGTLLAITGGTISSFTKGESDMFAINGTTTMIPWSDDAQISIQKGYWAVGGTVTDIKVPTTTDKVLTKVLKQGEEIIFVFDDGTEIRLKQTLPAGFYFLSEGAWGRGDGELSYFSYDIDKDEYQFVEEKRVSNFGELPNSMIKYGSKLYIAVTGTEGVDNSYIKVLNAADGKVLKEIKTIVEEQKLQPRQLVSYKGEVYASLYSGYVMKIDTLNFEPKYTPVTGTHSEGLVAYDDELFICQSGQGNDNKISIVDLTKFEEKETIEVGYNPGTIVSDGKGTLYFNTLHVYSGPAQGTVSSIHKLDAKSRKITGNYDVRNQSIALIGDYLYTTDVDWMSSDYASSIKKISTTTDEVSDFAEELPMFMFVNRVVGYDPYRREIFFGQQMGADIFRYSETGELLQTIRAKEQNGAAMAFVWQEV
ncbi:MAG: hypothetical protein Q4D93_05965 [Porphyromonas sp.]|nr:hypothetical protein [Porphyromonas sp.]